MALVQQVLEVVRSATIQIETNSNVFSEGAFSVRLPPTLAVSIQPEDDKILVRLNPRVKVSGPCGIGLSVNTLTLEDSGLYADLPWPLSRYKISIQPEDSQ